jgi:ABC-type nitrate/sulfonate/bicarbonate transport system permease component
MDPLEATQSNLPGIDPTLETERDLKEFEAEVAAQHPSRRRKYFGWLVSDEAARWTARLAALAIWAIAGAAFNRIPTPWATFDFILDEAKHGELWGPIWVTLKRAIIGLSIVLVLGVILGFLMGRFWPIRYLTTDLVMAAIALPAFIWALLAVMWFGFSEEAPIFVCVVSATPMLIVNTREGASAVDHQLSKMSAAYKVGLIKQFRHLVLPTMSEYIFAGFRVAVLAGWGAILLVEWFGNGSGMGWRAQYWYDAVNFEGMLAWGVLMLVVIVAIDRLIMQPALNRTRRWRAREDQAWS